MRTKRLILLMVVAVSLLPLPARSEDPPLVSIAWYRDSCGTSPDENGTVFTDVALFDGRWPTREEFREAYTKYCEVQVRSVPRDYAKIDELNSVWTATIRLMFPNDLIIECSAADVDVCKDGCTGRKSTMCPFACDLAGVKCAMVMKSGETKVTRHCQCVWLQDKANITRNVTDPRSGG